MADRVVTVGDDLTLPASVKAADANMPARLAAAALNTNIGTQIGTPGSAANAALAARSAHNILDFGVTRGTATSQTVAIKAALDSKPGAAFYFPPGDYRLDTGLVIGKSNSLVLSEGTRIYAGAPMTTLITFFKDTSGYAEDKSITGHGWLLDGNLNAQRILSLGKVIRFSLTGGNFKDGINRGIVTEAGLGAELIASDLRFYNSGITNIADNIAIEAKMGDSHYRDIVIRDWTTAVKDTSANRWDRVHPWISQDSGGNTQMTSRYPTSLGFDITGSSDLQACVTDTYRVAYKFRTNGTSYTPPARLLNSRAMWANDPILPTAIATANPAYVVDNTDAIGFVSDRLTMTGHSTVKATFLLGPSTLIDSKETYSYGFVNGAQGTTTDSMDYRNGVQQGSFTFTPTITGSGGAGSHAYTSRTGRMVVTRDTVTYYIRIVATLDSTTAFAGALQVSGFTLPYGATSLRDGAGSLSYSVNVNASSAVIFGSPTPNIAIMSLGVSGTAAVDIPGQALRGKSVDLMIKVSATYIKS